MFLERRHAFNINHFSLLELMAAIAITAILISVSFGIYSSVKNSVAESQTEAFLKQTASLIKKLESKAGFYPQGDGLSVDSSNFSKQILWMGISDRNGSDFQYTLTSNISWINSDNEPLDVTNNLNFKLAEALNKMQDMTSFKNTACKYIIKSNKRLYYLVDGWGRPVYYDTTGAGGVPFRLISTGQDGFVGNSNNKTLFTVNSSSIVNKTITANEKKVLGVTGDDLVAE